MRKKPTKQTGAPAVVLQRVVSLRWSYSRNQRRHTAWTERDGEMFWIQSCAPMSEIQGKHGYRLRYADGGHIQHSKFVALLKGIASQKANTRI